jgi:hypothetical protein
LEETAANPIRLPSHFKMASTERENCDTLESHQQEAMAGGTSPLTRGTAGRCNDSLSEGDEGYPCAIGTEVPNGDRQKIAGIRVVRPDMPSILKGSTGDKVAVMGDGGRSSS